MNNLHSNERQLADKLRNPPLPDMEQSWQQMRSLLDRDLPEPVGAWTGNKKWWWMGVTAGVIMLAAWLTQFMSQPDPAIARTVTQNSNGTISKEKNSIAETSKNNVVKSQVVTTNPGDKEQGQSLNDTKQEFTIEAKTGQAQVAIPNSSSIPRQVPAAKNAAGTLSRKGSTVSVTEPVFSLSNSKKISPQSAILKNDPGTLTSTVDNDEIINNVNGQPERSAISDARFARLNFGLDKSQLTAPGIAFENVEASEGRVRAISGKTDKKALRELRKKNIKDDSRRISKAGMRGNFGNSGKDITFAAGLSLPQNLSMSGQQSPSYGVNGKTNRLTDYLPAPFFQYYLNSKLFLQTEFHFQSPQYTNRLLLAKSSTQPSTSTQLEKSIYLEKLYYFNIPINIYYSPVRNFSIGSGFQYSSLLSGVASFEERKMDAQNPVSFQSVTRRFKDDSVAAKFSPSEWRYQFDANYYFKRFTLGMRYNQAMKQFVNIRVNPNLPVTQDRNRALLLYLRFNIWEERKKD